MRLKTARHPTKVDSSIKKTQKNLTRFANQIDPFKLSMINFSFNSDKILATIPSPSVSVCTKRATKNKI